MAWQSSTQDRQRASKTPPLDSGRTWCIVAAMSPPILPIATALAPAAPYSRALLVEQLRGLISRPATGYLAITAGERLYLLFIFQGRPYAAGLLVHDKPAQLTITNLCAQLASIRDNSGTLALYETDPVLLKSLLVFLQDEPAAKGPLPLINLEGMVRQIHEQAADALVVLERDGRHNLFFFLDGTKTAAYWSEKPLDDLTGLQVDEQMLLYAYQKADHPVNATIYLTLNTMESRDSSTVSLEGLVRLFAEAEESDKTIGPGSLTLPHYEQLRLQVLEGDQAGTTLGGALPCVLGRKDADIIINDPMVSKRHAAIQCVNGRLVLIDLHSTNGTTLNGEPVTQRELKQGDRIGLGQTLLQVESINPS